MELSMRRILMSVAVVTVMAVLLVAIAAPAFAVGNGKDYGGGKEHNRGNHGEEEWGWRGTGDSGNHGEEEWGWRGTGDSGMHGDGDWGVGDGVVCGCPL